MSTIGQRQTMRKLYVIGLCVALGALTAQAQYNAPLTYESVGPVTNEFGNILKGTSGGGPVVHLLEATDGVIYPPDTNGVPDARNTLIAESYIGDGVLEFGGVNEERFSGGLRIDRSQPTKLFARVFSEAGSFYADSNIYTNPTESYGQWEIAFGPTIQPLDAGDNDGAGLNNSWEQSYGADSNDPDTDGDGMSDGDEHRAGTGPVDEYSYLAMVRLYPDVNGMRVEWDSVPGKRYQVQLSSPSPEYTEVYTNISEVLTATTNTLFTTVTNIAPGPLQFFRVRLVEE